MASLVLTNLTNPSISTAAFLSNPNTNNTRAFFFFPRNSASLPKFNLYSVSRSGKANASTPSLDQQHAENENEEENFQVLTAIRSKYNDIVILDTPMSRLLLLDSTHNVHSILNKGLHKWTGSYWDEFVSLPAIVPKGPIAIYGLGGGTAAHLMLEFWSSLQLEGWEIDEILIDKARDYFGLSDLEKHTQAGGILHVHIDDVFSPTDNVSGRYAGIVIDLFSEGKVLAQLEEVVTWLKLKDRLMPSGRFMVNCGDISGESDLTCGAALPKSADDIWMQNFTIKALSKAFPGQVSWKRMPKKTGKNFLALTGPWPDLSHWSATVPGHLSKNVKEWKPCVPSP